MRKTDGGFGWLEEQAEEVVQDKPVSRHVEEGLKEAAEAKGQHTFALYSKVPGQLGALASDRDAFVNGLAACEPPRAYVTETSFSYSTGRGDNLQLLGALLITSQPLVATGE